LFHGLWSYTITFNASIDILRSWLIILLIIISFLYLASGIDTSTVRYSISLIFYSLTVDTSISVDNKNMYFVVNTNNEVAMKDSHVLSFITIDCGFFLCYFKHNYFSRIISRLFLSIHLCVQVLWRECMRDQQIALTRL
jgi:hypothetical protein